MVAGHCALRLKHRRASVIPAVVDYPAVRHVNLQMGSPVSHLTLDQAGGCLGIVVGTHDPASITKSNPRKGGSGRNFRA